MTQPSKIDRKITQPQVSTPALDSLWGADILRRNGLVYDLYAVAHHSGSLSAGHYTSHAKVGGRWMYFNDAHVSEASEASLQSSTAYILFYMRRDMDDQS